MAGRLQPKRLDLEFGGNNPGDFASSMRDSLFQQAIRKVDQWNLNKTHRELVNKAKKLAAETFNDYRKALEKASKKHGYTFQPYQLEEKTFIDELVAQTSLKFSNRR